MTPPTAVLTADPAAELHACLDRVALVDADGLDADGQADLLRSMTRAEARIAAVKLGVLAAAERSRTALRSGAASTGQWAAKVVNADQAAAHRQVGLAQGLDRRVATQRALSVGDISPGHAAVIIQADRQLPTQIKAEQRELVERTLISKAQTLSPGALRKAARRALAEVEDDAAVVDAHENEIVADLEARARVRSRLTLHDNADGTVSGHFTIPVLQGHLLRKVLETITAPRRSRLGAAHAQAGDRAVQNFGVDTDWDRARGEAFCELLEHLPIDIADPAQTHRRSASDGGRIEPCRRPHRDR